MRNLRSLGDAPSGPGSPRSERAPRQGRVQELAARRRPHVTRWRAVVGARWRQILGPGVATLALAAAVPHIPAGITLPSPTYDAAAPVLAPGVSFNRASNWLGLALQARGTTLANLASSITAANTPQAAALDAIVAKDEAGIGDLAAQLPSAPNLAGIETEASSMVLDYRIYSMLQPQIHSVLAISHDEKNLAALSATVSRLGVAVTTVREAGGKVHAAAHEEQILNTLVNQLSNRLSSVTSALVALVPAAYPAKGVFSAASAANNAAPVVIHNGNEDVRVLVSLLARVKTSTKHG
jgi:hypothetical protein